jgi:DNA-binding PadR family transcriptional regulator
MANRFGRFESVVAAALARLDGPASSAEILAEILETGGTALAANVYATLGRLEGKSIVTSAVETILAPDRAKRAVTFYTLTKTGREELKFAIERLKLTVSVLPRPGKAA